MKKGYNLERSRLQASMGFTLVELLIVIAIIGILTSIVITAVRDARARAYNAKAISELDSLKKAIVLYYQETGNVPDDGTPAGYCNITTSATNCGLNVLVTKGYFKEIPKGTSTHNYFYNRFPNATDPLLRAVFRARLNPEKSGPLQEGSGCRTADNPKFYCVGFKPSDL